MTGAELLSTLAFTTPTSRRQPRLEQIAQQTTGRTASIFAETPATHSQNAKRWGDYLALTFPGDPYRTLFAPDDVQTLNHPAYFKGTPKLAAASYLFAHELGQIVTGGKGPRVPEEHAAETWAQAHWRAIFKLLTGIDPTPAQQQVAAGSHHDLLSGLIHP